MDLTNGHFEKNQLKTKIRIDLLDNQFIINNITDARVAQWINKEV